MNPVVIRSVVVIVLRTLIPLIGGAGLALGDTDLEQIAAGLLTVGYVFYQAWKRVKGKKEVATEIAIARSEPVVETTVDREFLRRG